MNVLAILLNIAVITTSVLLIRSFAAQRPVAGADDRIHDLYEAAFLNGGPARVVDTALTAMQTDGRLAVGGPGIVAVLRNEARDPVERAVLQELAAAPSGALHTLRAAVMRHPAVQETGDGLAARGLLVAPATNRPLRVRALVQGFGCLLALPVCFALTIVEYGMHEGYANTPFPFVVKVLPVLLIGSLIGMLTASSTGRRTTKAGRRAADGYRAAHAYVMTPPLLVATMGLRALPDPVLQAQLIAATRVRPTAGRRGSTTTTDSSASSAALLVPAVWCAGSDPGGSSCGSSSGGGGGGGGGCGSGGGSSCSSGSSCGGSSGSSGGSSCGGSSGGSSCGSSS